MGVFLLYSKYDESFPHLSKACFSRRGTPDNLVNNKYTKMGEIKDTYCHPFRFEKAKIETPNHKIIYPA